MNVAADVRIVRVFVSSPVDVAPERGRVQAVAAKLNRDFEGLVRFETVLWEENFYKADRSFQPQIPTSVACDMLVSIFWTRVGTELPGDFARMPNGEPYASGTAYELLTALEASKAKGVPDVYVFRKTADAALPTADAERRRLSQLQLDALEAFWSEWFKSEHGHFKAAFQTFGNTDEFERQVEQLLRQWLESHGLLGPRLAWPQEKGSPFRGLAPFEAQHAAVFFGRDSVIDEARRHLIAAAERATPFLLIVGASGAGKSFLVRAGLVPRLTAPGVVDRIDVWRVALMRPGSRPIEALAEALFAGRTADMAPALPELIDGNSKTPAELATLLHNANETAVRPVLRALDRIAVEERKRRGLDRPAQAALLLVVDQLDDLFAADISAADRTVFAALLRALVVSERVWVVATLRASLYEPFLNEDALKVLKDAGADYAVAAPGLAELTEIVRRPAAAAALTYERNAAGERLDDKLLRDAVSADTLPLLQFALQRLYEMREVVDGETRLTHAAYAALGGIGGAIDQAAERALAGLGEAEFGALPQLFRSLAVPVHDVTQGAHSALTIRAAPLAEVATNASARRLVNALVEARILLVSEEGGVATVRLAHQRVLESWTRARDIVASNADFFRIRDEVEQQRRRWEASGRKTELLIPRGLPLAEAEKIVATYEAELDPALCAFVASSSRYARRRLRLTAAAAAVFGIVAIVASMLGLLAMRSEQRAVAERSRADQQRNEAQLTQSRFLADLANQRVNENPTQAFLLALEALPDTRLGIERPYAEEAEAALFGARHSLRETAVFGGHQKWVVATEYSSDGLRVVTGSADRTARIWDIKTGKEIAIFKGHTHSVTHLGLSRDGRRLATSSEDGTARLWNAQTGEQIAIFPNHRFRSDFQFSADGTRLLTQSSDNSARIWDAETGKEILVLKGHEGSVDSAAFSPDGRQILTVSSDRTARLWDAETGHVITILNNAGSGVDNAVLSPNGRRIVLLSKDSNVARVWDLETDKQVAVLRGHDGGFLTASFSADGRRIVTGSEDKTARIWNAETGDQVLVLGGYEGGVQRAFFSADGLRLFTQSSKKTLLSNANDGNEIAVLQVNGFHADFHGRYLITSSWVPDTTQVWDAETGKKIATLKGGGFGGAKFSPDGKHLLTGCQDGTTRIWDIEFGRDIVDLEIYQRYLSSVAFSSDGQRVLTGSWIGAQIWDAATGKEIRTFSGDKRTVHDVRALGLDGRRALTTSDQYAVRLWNTETGQPMMMLGADALGVKFSRDGSRIVTASLDGTARLWGAETGSALTVFAGHDGPVRDAEFSPDGRRLVTSSGGTARIWDVGTGNELLALTGHEASVESAVFSPDGLQVLTKAEDKTARLWDARTGKQIAVLGGHESAVESAVFSSDGRRMETVSADQTVRLWDTENGNQLVAIPGRKYQIWQSAFSPDGRRLITMSWRGPTQLWDIETGAILAVLNPRDDRGAHFSPDSRRAVTYSDDKTAQISDAETGKKIAALKGLTADLQRAAFNPDGSRILTVSYDDTVQVWDTETGNAIMVLNTDKEKILDAQFSEDGRRIITSSKTSLRMWDAGTGKQLTNEAIHFSDAYSPHAFSPDGRRAVARQLQSTAEIWQSETNTKVAVLGGLSTRVLVAALSNDGKRALTRSLDDQVRIWNAETGREIVAIKLSATGLYDFTFSPDNRRLMAGSHLWDVASGAEITLPAKVSSITFSPDGPRVLLAFDDDGATQIWDPETGKTIASFKQDSKTEGSAVFSPDGRRVAIPALDKSVRIWDVETSKEIAVLAGHSDWVRSAAFSADGKRIVTASDDKTARVWDVATGKLIAMLAGHEDSVQNALFSPDGGRVLTVSTDSTAKLWPIFRTTQELVDQAKTAVPSCLSPKERETNFLDAAPPAWCIEMEKWPYQTQAWKDWLRYERANLKPPLADTPEWQPWLAAHDTGQGTSLPTPKSP